MFLTNEILQNFQCRFTCFIRKGRVIGLKLKIIQSIQIVLYKLINTDFDFLTNTARRFHLKPTPLSKILVYKCK